MKKVLKGASHMSLRFFLCLMVIIVCQSHIAEAALTDIERISQAMQLTEQQPPDTSKALPLLRDAANNGNIEAAYDLGVALC